MVGATAQGEPIYIGDIAEVKDTIKETRYVGPIQGEKGVFLFVSKRSGANTALVGNAVKKEMENSCGISPSRYQVPPSWTSPT